MKQLKISILLFIISGSLIAQSLTVSDLTCEFRINPVGIDVPQPRLSWKISGTGNNIMQTAYMVRVSADPKFSSSKIVWESGKVLSDESHLVPYKGSGLRSGQRYFWQVRIWDNKGRSTKWSPAAYWEMGLLSPSDWKAKWIELEDDTNRYSPSPHFRKEFTITKPVTKATVYVTSHGLYDLNLNGKRVGDEVMTPGWTSYGKGFNTRYTMSPGRLQRGKMQLALSWATVGTGVHLPGAITGQFMVKDSDFCYS